LIGFKSLTIAAFAFAAMAGAAFAQGDNPRQRPVQEDLPKNIKESLAKQRIENEKKEHAELVKRTEEAVKLSEELEKAFNEKPEPTSIDFKKLDRLEKLVRKIRGDLGGDDDDPDKTEKERAETPPEDLVGAFRTLQSSAAKLFDEVRKSTRYSVSVVAIQSSNILLKVLKFIRFRN
jgi:hypothetical protein